MSLCNDLVYKNSLKMGNESVAKQSIIFKENKLIYEKNIWLKKLLNCKSGVTFIDTKNFVKWRRKNLTESSDSPILKLRASQIQKKEISKFRNFSSRSQGDENDNNDDLIDLLISEDCNLSHELLVYIIKNYLKYMSKSTYSITVITPFNKDRSYIELKISVSLFLIFRIKMFKS